MPMPSEVMTLVKRFATFRDAYRSGEYNETRLRREFLDPMFEALGWDMQNRGGTAEQYKDVIHEDAIKIGGASKAPDYCFRLGGKREFFVEAKKPSVNIKDDVGPAFQLRRYAWSAKLPLSVLTDFEEFAIYDCRVRPYKGDNAAVARIMYATFDEYESRWDEIASKFSRDAALGGAIRAFTVSSRRKRGSESVDQAFLEEIERWRESLAKSIAAKNAGISQRELNSAVQRTIDRIVFLRICEDRGIEEYGRLLAVSNGNNVYERLCERFTRADERYNSGLFHFGKEKHRAEAPDTLTMTLRIDDKILKNILRNLYYPESPYEFAVLPADILGQVYEQFLGKVIRLTPRGAAIDEKPEVKKAGGVYYTPSHIVQHIVEGALKDVLARKRPRDVARLRILDPACGSGSFLIVAYQALLDWHFDYYFNDDPKRHPKEMHQTSTGGWRLTTTERKRVLLNNIFGVDVDPQAVEVTKLSLLLKVLEGETAEAINQQLKLVHERALPDLGANIKCGNSLVATDYFNGRQASLLDDAEAYQINAFDWEAEFAPVVGDKGFDVILGNPPWLMPGYYLPEHTLEYLSREYHVATGKYDMYYVFLERALDLLRPGGRLGMIVPNKFFHTGAGAALRSLLIKERGLRLIEDFGDAQVFRGATNYSCMLELRREPSASGPTYRRMGVDLAVLSESRCAWEDLTSTQWNFDHHGAGDVFAKVKSVGEPLETMVSRFGTGVQSGADRLLVMEPAVAADKGYESAVLRRVFRGRDVRRYATAASPRVLVFPYAVRQGEFEILDEKKLGDVAPRVHKLLRDSRPKLATRVWFGKGAEALSGRWYGMMYLDSARAFAAPHLLTPALSNQSNFALGTGDVFATGTAGVTSIIPKDDNVEHILYLLGVLNSKLISVYAVAHSPPFAGGYFKFSAPYLKKLPIRRIRRGDKQAVAQHDEVVRLVERILSLRASLGSIRAEHEQQVVQRQIDAASRRIDEVVYDLYGLSDDERAQMERHFEVPARGRGRAVAADVSEPSG